MSTASSNHAPRMRFGGAAAPGCAAARAEHAAFSLKANFLWTFAGNVVYAASQWAMLSLLAKLGSAEMVGQFALGLAVTTPVLAIASLQLRAVQATDAQRKFSFAEYLTLRLATTATALLAIVGIVAMAGYGAETAWIILAVAAYASIDAINDVLCGLFQQHERMDRIAVSMMLKGLVSLAALWGCLYYWREELLFGVIAMAAARVVVLLGYDVPNAIPFWRRERRFHSPLMAERKSATASTFLHRLPRLAWTAFPLGLTALLLSLNGNIPRYFMEHSWGTHGLGFFAAVAYLMVPGTTVIGALGNSASPRLAQYYQAGRLDAFRGLLLKLVGIVVLVGIAGIAVAAIAGGPILTLLYRPEYAAYSSAFVAVMIASVFSFVASMLGYGATACEQRSRQPFLLLVVVLTALASGWWLIPRWGVEGAACSLILSHGVCMIGYLWILRARLLIDANRVQDPCAAAKTAVSAEFAGSMDCGKVHWPSRIQ